MTYPIPTCFKTVKVMNSTSIGVCNKGGRDPLLSWIRLKCAVFYKPCEFPEQRSLWAWQLPGLHHCCRKKSSIGQGESALSSDSKFTSRWMRMNFLLSSSRSLNNAPREFLAISASIPEDSSRARIEGVFTIFGLCLIKQQHLQITLNNYNIFDGFSSIFLIKKVRKGPISCKNKAFLSII